MWQGFRYYFSAFDTARIGYTAQHVSNSGIGEYLPASAGNTHVVKVVADGVGSHAFIDVFLKDKLHSGGFFGNTLQILDRQTVLVKAAKVDALISIRGRAAVVAAFFRKLFQVGTDANRSLFTFPGGLPEADIVGELGAIKIP